MGYKAMHTVAQTALFRHNTLSYHGYRRSTYYQKPRNLAIKLTSLKVPHRHTGSYRNPPSPLPLPLPLHFLQTGPHPMRTKHRNLTSRCPLLLSFPPSLLPITRTQKPSPRHRHHGPCTASTRFQQTASATLCPCLIILRNSRYQLNETLHIDKAQDGWGLKFWTCGSNPDPLR
jgi:hypothetical protein